MDPINRMIVDLARMQREAEQADSPVKTESVPETYHEVADRLTHNGWQLDACVDNDERLDRERQKVIDAIELAASENGGELTARDRKRFAMRLRPLYREAADENVAWERMTRAQSRPAIDNAISFTIDGTVALWREKNAPRS